MYDVLLISRVSWICYLLQPKFLFLSIGGAIVAFWPYQSWR